MTLTINEDLKQADVLQIKRMIPHRYPFLMIDRWSTWNRASPRWGLRTSP